MPLYTYRCAECGAERDEFNRIDDRHASAPSCAACAVQMAMVISPVRGSVQGDCNYRCPATGKVITNHAQRRNVMAEAGLVDARDLTPSFVVRKAKERRDELRREAAKLDIPNIDLTPYTPALPA